MPSDEDETSQAIKDSPMPYAVLEEKIAGIAPEYQGELLAFVDFLLFKQKNSASVCNAAINASVPIRQRELSSRVKALRGSLKLPRDLAEKSYAELKEEYLAGKYGAF